MKADEIRALADYAAIQQFLDSLPWADQVGPRPFGSLSALSADVASLPRNPEKRLSRLLHLESSRLKSLSIAIARYDEVKSRGLDAISDADLSGVYCDSGALRACRDTMSLLEAHVSYYRSVLEILEWEISKIDKTVPPGYSLVEVVLPAIKAYEVKRWAKAAEPGLARARKKMRLNAKGKNELTNESSDKT